MKKYNVLVFPCGAENALEIYEALKSNVLIDVAGASSIDDHGKFAFEKYIGGLPYIFDPNFIEQFNKIIADNEIDFIFPTHDTVALFFSENRERINAKIICSDYETALICREKSKTFALFKDEFFIPQSFDLSNQDITYPVFVKPNIGEGAKGTAIINSSSELNFYSEHQDDFLIHEYLPGLELTVDCFTDRHGKLRFIGPRTRERIKMGISFHSESYPLTSEVSHIATSINNKLSFRGLWFFQLKQNSKKQFKLLEVSTRCAGTMSLYRQLGVNFPLLSVFDAADLDVEILYNENKIVLDRCLYTRFIQHLYFTTVYIDFDDTIIVNSKVNFHALKFLYQCVEQGIKVVLITRHEKDLTKTLSEKRIAYNLFDEIIHLKQNECKGDCIVKERDAIFIDNAFKERKIVKSKCNIPVFDVDAIQSLTL
ncbi:ATP-grasp domain-containing protein [Pontibacter cellulosilyticus]|uniref:ATP-grasp domain-containing protein n=1 Tax=Pontibacter cellulosilyticus TaxID=1720253 RepID=A0A923N517_9BACT|nr:ATP-grasp domain-containing protein [Pontibacter cellulosilyticus]MBC5991606.1 ATP-grasp domain-containing protein [Pontibacter cellulosilyticus]